MVALTDPSPVDDHIAVKIASTRAVYVFECCVIIIFCSDVACIYNGKAYVTYVAKIFVF